MQAPELDTDSSLLSPPPDESIRYPVMVSSAPERLDDWKGKKLDGLNYTAWSRRFRLAIKSRGLLSHLDVEPTDADKENSDWSNKDAYCSYLLVSSVNETYEGNINMLDFAYEMWSKLKTILASKDIDRLQPLFQEFNNPKYQVGESATVLSDRLERTSALIADIDPAERPSDRLKLSILIQTLRKHDEALEAVVQIIGSQDTKYTDALAKLEATQERLARDKAVAPMNSLNSGRNSGRNPGRNPGRNLGRNLWNSRQTGKRPFTGKCFHCNKPGHIRRECSVWLKTEEGKKLTAHEEKESEVWGPANTLRELRLDPEVADDSVIWGPINSVQDVLGNSTEWCIDSGCANHVCCNKDLFVQESLHRTRRFRAETASGQEVISEWSGSVVLQVQNKSTQRPVRIEVKDVTYMPQFTTNLLSVAQLKKYGQIADFGRPGGADIRDTRDKRNRIVATATERNHTFYLDIQEDTTFVANFSGKSKPQRLHEVFGHIGQSNLKDLYKSVQGIDEKLSFSDLEKCEVCVKAKQTRVINRVKQERAKEPLWRLHFDVWGPYYIAGLQGELYLYCLIDDATRKSWVGGGSNRKGARSWLYQTIECEERRLGKKVSCIRIDGASELVAMEKDLLPRGIRLEQTTPYHSYMNGSAERLIRALIDITRSLLLHWPMPQRFWFLAAQYANELRNRWPIGPDGKSPYEAYYGRKPHLSDIHQFGCLAYNHVPLQQRKKLDSRAVPTIFVGFGESPRQVLLYNVEKSIVIRGTDIEYFEERTIDQVRLQGSGELVGEIVDAEDTLVDDPFEDDDYGTIEVDLGESGGRNSENTDSPIQAPPQDQSEPLEVDLELEQGTDRGALSQEAQADPSQEVRRSNRAINRPATYMESRRKAARLCRRQEELTEVRFNAFSTKEVRIPNTYDEAINDPEYGGQWKQATIEEIEKLQDLNCWEIKTKIPVGRKPVGYRWVFTAKVKENQPVFKARLVAQSFSQIHGFDYFETFSPTLRIESFRLLLAIATYLDLEIHQWDIVSAYINADLTEDIYMKVPKALGLPPGTILKVLKSLYGLKQSGREWYHHAATKLTQLGFQRLECDWTIFQNAKRGILIGLYVDDMIIVAKDIKDINTLRIELSDIYKVKDLKEINLCLGQRVTRDRKLGTLWIDQERYIQECLDYFKLNDLAEANSPVDGYEGLRKAQEGDVRADQVLY